MKNVFLMQGDNRVVPVRLWNICTAGVISIESVEVSGCRGMSEGLAIT